MLRRAGEAERHDRAGIGQISIFAFYSLLKIRDCCEKNRFEIRSPADVRAGVEAGREKRSAPQEKRASHAQVDCVLLDLLGRDVVADEVFEDGQDVAAIFDDALEHRAEARLALGFAVPFGKYGGRYGDIPAKLFGFMATQEEAIEKRGFPLRKLEVLQDLLDRIGLRGHIGKGSLQISALASSLRAGLPAKQSLTVRSGAQLFAQGRG